MAIKEIRKWFVGAVDRRFDGRVVTLTEQNNLTLEFEGTLARHELPELIQLLTTLVQEADQEDDAAAE